MKLQKFLAGVLLAVCLPLQSVHACTLWAAAGTAAEGGGTILAKKQRPYSGSSAGASFDRTGKRLLLFWNL